MIENLEIKVKKPKVENTGQQRLSEENLDCLNLKKDPHDLRLQGAPVTGPDAMTCKAIINSKGKYMKQDQ